MAVAMAVGLLVAGRPGGPWLMRRIGGSVEPSLTFQVDHAWGAVPVDEVAPIWQRRLPRGKNSASARPQTKNMANFMNDRQSTLRKHDQSALQPMKIFAEWLQLAENKEPNDPTAMALASVDADGMPNVRMVLMRGHDGAGIVFYTNFESAKGVELLASNKAAACAGSYGVSASGSANGASGCT